MALHDLGCRLYDDNLADGATLRQQWIKPQLEATPADQVPFATSAAAPSSPPSSRAAACTMLTRSASMGKA